MHQQTLTTPDGTAIVLRSWEATGEPQGSVVIGGAMGVRQDYYAPFAEWLAQQGWRVTTFDYRGSGLSMPAGRSLRDVDADLFDWARDFEATIENAPQLKRMVLYFWYVLVPVATRLFGYFPGRKLRKVGDLPRGVILQWRRWCLDPRYSVGAEGEPVRRRYAGATFPVLALSITDDELMTLRGTNSLLALYENARREVHRIAPADLALRRIGHFGPFRTEQEQALWPRMAQWLAGLSAPRAA